MPVANARMYSVTPAVKAAWHDLFAWVLVRAGLDWDIVDYDAPAPLSELWRRGDLGLAMMCGLPFSRREPPATLIAAPIPSGERYDGHPVYMSDIIVRADSPYRSVADSAGGVVGYTRGDSLSGGVAPRAFLSVIAYGKEEEFATPRQVIDALVEGRIDVGPLDSYWHDLLREHDPHVAARIRTIASTPPLPIPPLVATAQMDHQTLQRLRGALADAGEAPALRPLFAQLLLRGFAFPDRTDYSHLARSRP
ncbi:MAG TPA: PhnD/SsuA/transferrin family substrate-binding protein [Ramlibacter sp.]